MRIGITLKKKVRNKFDTTQRRRETAVAFIQQLQRFIQNRIIAAALKSDKPFQPPLPMRILSRSAFVQRKFAQILAYGFKPEMLDEELR